MPVNMTEGQPIDLNKAQKKQYWIKLGLSLRQGLKMHILSGHRERDIESRTRPWGNITEHCLVQAARVDILGNWVGLPPELISDMKLAAVLHDFSKKQEIEAIREADREGRSPLSAAKTHQQKSNLSLKEAGFSERVIRLANSAGGQAPELFETKRILDEPTVSDDDLAYLIVHYVDDCSVGNDWVLPVRMAADGNRSNIIDYRAEENKAKPAYRKISEEIGEELKGSPFEGINNHDAMAVVSHQIEQRLAQIIGSKTGEIVDPLEIPELVDQKITLTIATVAG